jgi:PhnB protein
MAGTNGKPAGIPSVSPYLCVRDSDQALEFYTKAFGFVKKDAVSLPDGRTGHCEMTHKESLIIFGPEGAYGGTCKAPVTLGIQSPVSLYVYCDDIDALCTRAKSAGVKVEMPPTDMFWGDRMCKLVDPDGHVWNFATHVGHPTPTPAGAAS